VPYEFLADAVLLVHFGIVLFVVGGLVLIVAGNGLQWRWVDRWWFRLVHLGTIAFVVAESWLGLNCPLTSLESWLRVHAGAPSYHEGFIEHWVHAILFFDAPSWVFATGYSLFGLLVVLVWWRLPPRRHS
jgi:hypothetical protein